MVRSFLVAAALLGVVSGMSKAAIAVERGFAEDVAFLREHVETIVLGEEGGPPVAVVPA